jgi:hypothetical protein
MELLGMEDVARELGITENTAAVWRHRGKLPEADWIISGRPIWRASVIRRWRARELHPAGKASR